MFENPFRVKLELISLSWNPVVESNTEQTRQPDATGNGPVQST